jgi:cbb3-type cytochrome oxidase subunit 3
VPLMESMVKDHLAAFLAVLVLVFLAIGVWAAAKRRRRVVVVAGEADSLQE